MLGAADLRLGLMGRAWVGAWVSAWCMGASVGEEPGSWGVPGMTMQDRQIDRQIPPGHLRYLSTSPKHECSLELFLMTITYPNLT